jgi:hypothetical protein
MPKKLVSRKRLIFVDYWHKSPKIVSITLSTGQGSKELLLHFKIRGMYVRFLGLLCKFQFDNYNLIGGGVGYTYLRELNFKNYMDQTPHIKVYP